MFTGQECFETCNAQCRGRPKRLSACADEAEAEERSLHEVCDHEGAAEERSETLIRRSFKVSSPSLEAMVSSLPVVPRAGRSATSHAAGHSADDGWKKGSRGAPKLLNSTSSRVRAGVPPGARIGRGGTRDKGGREEPGDSGRAGAGTAFLPPPVGTWPGPGMWQWAHDSQ